jgi:hypothetical protein
VKLEHRDITLALPSKKLTPDEMEDITIRFKYAVDKLYKECGDSNAVLWVLHYEAGNTWTKVLSYLRGLRLAAL